MRADKISDATRQRLVRLFDTLGQKTNWHFSLELGDDEQKAEELAEKLENGNASILGSGELDKTQIMALLNPNLFRSRISTATRCLDLQYNLPYENTFCDVNLIDPDLLPHPFVGAINAKNIGIKVEDKANSYLLFLKGKASFDYRILSFEGTPSVMSDPDVKVTGPSCNVFDLLDALCLTQKHSHFLYMAYMIPQPQPEQRVDLYIGK
jgi:hypothetical protein